MLAGSEVTGMGATMTVPPLKDNMWGIARGSEEKQRKGKPSLWPASG